MKTTIDLPEETLHRAKIVAAQRKTSLKQLVIQGLHYATLHDPSSESIERRERAQRLWLLLGKSRSTAPVGPLHREKLDHRQSH